MRLGKWILVGDYPNEILLLRNAYSQGLTSLTTTRFYNLLSVRTRGAATESVLVKTLTIAWLKGAFHAFLRRWVGVVRLRGDPRKCSINAICASNRRTLIMVNGRVSRLNHL